MKLTANGKYNSFVLILFTFFLLSNVEILTHCEQKKKLFVHQNFTITKKNQSIKKLRNESSHQKKSIQSDRLLLLLLLFFYIQSHHHHYQQLPLFLSEKGRSYDIECCCIQVSNHHQK